MFVCNFIYCVMWETRKRILSTEVLIEVHIKFATDVKWSI